MAPTSVSQHSGGATTPVSGHSGVAGYTEAAGHDRQLSPLLTLKPSLLWALDDASGAAVDASGNGRNGTPGGGTAFGQTGHAAGESAIIFVNAASSLITSAYSPFVVGSKRTFMGWAETGAPADNETLFGGSGSQPGAPQLVIRTTDQIDFLAGTLTSVGWAAAWVNGVWNHWALTYDDSSGTAELFIGGVSKGTRSLSGNGYSGSGGTFQAAAWGAGSDPMNGWQQDLAVFERILSAPEIAGAAAIGAGATAISAHPGPGYTEVKAH